MFNIIMIDDNDIMTITINDNIPYEFSPLSKFTILNNQLQKGAEIIAIPIDPNYNRPTIQGVFVSIKNEFNLFSRVTIKIRTNNNRYKSFMPIKYDIVYRYTQSKETLQRKAFIDLFESL